MRQCKFFGWKTPDNKLSDLVTDFDVSEWCNKTKNIFIHDTNDLDTIIKDRLKETKLLFEKDNIIKVCDF